MKNNNYKNSRKAIFKESRCDKSPFCPVVKTCKAGAVNKVKLGFMKIQIHYDPSKCVGCGQCVSACPHGAFGLK